MGRRVGSQPEEGVKGGRGAGHGADWLRQPVTVRVPATSANLGPGFDALGLALTLHDVVEARVIPDGISIRVSGAGQDSAANGEDHLVIRAMRAAFGVLGAQPPGIGLRCVNAIPQGYGLGSSAGAIVSGLLAARALAVGSKGLTDADVLRIATQIEGHPDNVAACLLGGVTIAWTSASATEAARLEPVQGLTPVLCVPAHPVLTETARGLLPPSVPHADASANAARAALLIAGLTVDPELLMAGTEDFLHQPYRAAAMPDTAGLIGRLRAAGIPAAVSGAGPAVLALIVAGTHPGPEAVEAIAGSAWRVHRLEIDRDGATLSPDGPDGPGHGNSQKT
jgi:homoserine kinase